MNDIYEYKAEKYKYKYLKLKREYYGEGGLKGRKTINKIRNSLGAELLPIDNTNKEIDHTKPASDEQKIFKQKLQILKKSIENDIVPLYKNNEIRGNINYYSILYCVIDEKKNELKKIFYSRNTSNIKLILNKKVTFKFDTNKKFDIKTIYGEHIVTHAWRIPHRENNMLHIYKIINEIDNRGNHPPILKWFYKLYNKKKDEQQKIRDEENKKRQKVGGESIPFKDVNTRITEDELFNELKLYLSEKNNNSLQIKNNNSLKIWKEFRIDFDKAFPKKETDYLMATIFSDCILDKLYIKNKTCLYGLSILYSWV